LSEHIFYSKQRKANERKAIIKDPIVLVGKALTKEKRIRHKVVMPLSNQKMGGTPEWILNTIEFVSKNHDTVKLDVVFSGFEIQYSSSNLFGPKTLTATKTKMKSFEIFEMGSSESPEIVMQFFVYVPFGTKLHTFLGQMAGEELWLKFTPPDPASEEEEESEELELTAEDEETGEEDEKLEDSEILDEDEEL